MKKILISIFLSAVMGTTVFASTPDNLAETSPAKVTGYYHSEDYDCILLANGTGYSIEDSASNLLEGPFAAFSFGNDFLLSSEDSYAYFHEQDEKGKTENGGIYYAVYTDFLGMEDEIGYKEGKQTNFMGYIFENDYEVFERNSLAEFFGVDITDGENGKMEGDGYDTPEEALGAYIRAFAANDIDGMIAAFAVETFAENYDVVKWVERIRGYTILNGYIPSVSEFSVRLNTERRRFDIIDMIRNQYLVLEGSKTVVGEGAYSLFNLNSGEYDDAQGLVDDLFLSDDSTILSEITFSDEFYAPELFSERYLEENNQESMKKQVAYLGAEDVTSVVAKFYVDEDPVLLMADAIKLNGKWYLNNFIGNISILLNVPSYSSGTIPLKYDDNREIASMIGE